ncbi:MAG: DUF6134 family protein [Paracoccaceae bacterium]
MNINRRALIGGISAGLLAPAGRLMASDGGQRRFTVYRDGAKIGSQVIDVRPGAGGGVQVAIDIELKIKVLGITAYVYTMNNRETWQGGRLTTMDSVTDDDGDRDYAKARAAGDMLEIDGSDFQGVVSGEAVSTTYWSMAFLDRRIWINTQTGVPIEVATARLGAGEVAGDEGPIATERWSAKGENLDIVLHYAAGEWVSVEFDAGGELALFRPQTPTPDFATVWADAS